MDSLSIIIPVFNEAENAGSLYQSLQPVLQGLGKSYEIIFVDDGSTDGSGEILKDLAERDSSVKVILFRRNYGQTAAMSAGFRAATGNIIIPMDADLQNDPADIPVLVEKMRDYDVVSGWRKDRQDEFFSRKLPSMIANKMISWISGVPLKDYGCTLKAYRASFIKNIRLFGEMHRFIPVYAHWMGARITEIPVQHHPRIRGKSKYNLMRTFKVILDLITVKFLGTFSTKPIYIFGGLGIFTCLCALFIAGLSLFQKMAYGIWVHRNPLFSISIFLFLASGQLLLMGLLAELVIRVYHESADRPTYWIQETVNLEEEICAASQDT